MHAYLIDDQYSNLAGWSAPEAIGPETSRSHPFLAKTDLGIARKCGLWQGTAGSFERDHGSLGDQGNHALKSFLVTLPICNLDAHHER
jgi:hypothetical protein